MGTKNANPRSSSTVISTSSLLKKPLNGTSPARDAAPIVNVTAVIGMAAPQLAHLADVGPARTVGDAARAEEQQGLGDAVDEQVEYGDGHPERAERQHHQALSG